MSSGSRQPPTGDSHDAAWIDAARRSLDASADSLDAQTLSRLARARAEAIATARRPRRSSLALPVVTLPFAAAAALAVAVLAWREPLPPALPVPPEATSAQDWAALISAPEATLANGDTAEPLPDDPALYEDLEFYAWLDAQPIDG